MYLMTRGQYITAGMGTIVDISIPAVKIAMDMLKVKDQAGCLQKVRELFFEFRPVEKGAKK